MSTYAATTSVSTEQSRAEIERTLQRWGADQFMYGWDGDRAVIGFRASGRQIKFVIDLPDRNDREFTHHSRGRRTADAALKAWEQACRQRWRALNLVIKAKLEAVESEFLAHIVLPDGSTVGNWIAPQIDTAYTTGQMPSMLPALGSGQ